MTNTTVAQTVSEVEAAANEARQIWAAAVEAERATWATGNVVAIKAASVAERTANATWKAAERTLQDMWRAEIEADEEARLQAMCEAHDTLEWDYADYNEGALDAPLPYMVTTAGMTYLDHHYHTDSEVTMLAAGGDSPYGDGRTGFIKPAPEPNWYVNGQPDFDERDRLENLAY